MKNFKKILVLALAVMMCLTALAVPTFAATFDTEIKITARFNETGDKIIASVVTTEPAGAIQGTLTYSGLTFDETKIDFSEKNSMEKHVHNDTNKTIKFVLLANNLNDGDTHWADFYFNVPTSGDVKFSLSDVKACDVNENLTDDAITVDDVTLTLTANELTTLGAQHRKADETKDVKAALRFGFRLDRTIDKNGNHILGENKKAVRCGFILAINTNGELTAEVDEDTGEISGVPSGALCQKATKCYKSEKEYMIYTAALQKIPDTELNTPVSARPFVVYFDTAREKYGCELGAVVTKSYADVKDASGLLDETLGLGYK